MHSVRRSLFPLRIQSTVSACTLDGYFRYWKIHVRSHFLRQLRESFTRNFHEHKIGARLHTEWFIFVCCPGW